jgi:hypothetical protein
VVEGDPLTFRGKNAPAPGYVEQNGLVYRKIGILGHFFTKYGARETIHGTVGRFFFGHALPSQFERERDGVSLPSALGSMPTIKIRWAYDLGIQGQAFASNGMDATPDG